LLTDAEVAATQEIADALSQERWTEGRDTVEGSAAAPAGGEAISRPRYHGDREDPLFIRRTVIPILLTCGVILAGWGAMLLFGGEDNAMSELFPSWAPIMFFVLASVFLALGALNILAVRNAEGEARRHEAT
jgi:hypothetical protein